VLHSGLISECPALLPAFRDAFNEVYEDRARSAQQRAALLGLGTAGGDGPHPKQSNTSPPGQLGRVQEGRRPGSLVNFKNLSLSEDSRSSAPGGLKGQYRSQSPAVSQRSRGKGGSVSVSSTNQMWQR
jgi:hypothetical protein